MLLNINNNYNNDNDNNNIIIIIVIVIVIITILVGNVSKTLKILDNVCWEFVAFTVVGVMARQMRQETASQIAGQHNIVYS